MTHTLISLNTKGTAPGLPLRAVVSDLRHVKRAEPSILLLQEVMPWRYWGALKAVYPFTRWGRFPGRFRAPGRAHVILWDRDMWRGIAADTIELHPSHPGITQRRYVVSVMLEHNASGLRLWVRNTHYVAGAWNNKHTPDDLIRRRLWDMGSINDMHQFRAVAADGYPVIAGGDYNRLNYRVLGSRYDAEDIRYVGPLGVDYIAVMDGTQARVIVRRDYVIPDRYLHTDHAARVVIFDIHRRGIA